MSEDTGTALGRRRFRGGDRDRPPRTIGDAFCRLAGAQLRTLDRVPGERGFYVALGMALLIPFTLGVVGASVVGHVVTGRPAVDPLLVVVGIVWGILVVIADRLVLAVRSVAQGKVLFILLRVCFALGTAVVVTEPLLAVWFGPEVIDRATEEFNADKIADSIAVKQDYESRRNAQAGATAPRQEQVQAEIGRLQSQVEAARATYDERQRVCDQETGGGRGPRGYGPEARVLCGAADRSDSALQRVESTNNSRIEELQAELAASAAPLEDLRRQEEEALELIEARSLELADLGLWRRIELTHEVVARWWLLALAGTLMVLDTLPVLIKAFRGETAHDERLASASRGASAVTRIETDDYIEEARQAHRERALDRALNARTKEAERRAKLEIAQATARESAERGWADDRKQSVTGVPRLTDQREQAGDGPSSHGTEDVQEASRRRRRRRLVSLPLAVSVLAASGLAVAGLASIPSGVEQEQPVAISSDRETIVQLRDGARVIVPPGAMADGSTVRALYRQRPVGGWGAATPVGDGVELLADPPDAIQGSVALEFPVPVGSGAGGGFSISTYNEQSRSWDPVPSTFDPDRGVVTAQIPHFSWYNPVSWDWASIGARVNQNVGQLLGKRSPEPTCTRGQPVPNWVLAVAGVTEDAGIAVRSCAEGEGDVLAVEVANNRPYGMVMTYGSPVKWGWHEPGDSAIDRARNGFVDAIIPANQLYLPPRGRASVGIPRFEGGPVNFHIGLTRLSFLADATAAIAGEAIGAIDGASCAKWILGADVGNLASPGAVRDLIKEMSPCVKEGLRSSGTAGALDGQTIARIESAFDAVAEANVVGKILQAYDVEWHLADIWVDTKIVGGVPGLGSGFSVLARREVAAPPAATPAPASPAPGSPRSTATTTTPTTAAPTTTPSTVTSSTAPTTTPTTATSSTATPTTTAPTTTPTTTATTTTPTTAAAPTTTPPTTSQPTPTPSVRISKGETVSRDDCNTAPCRWVQVSMSGFPGARRARVTCHSSSHPSFYTYETTMDAAGRGSAAGCYYGFTGHRVWVEVDGVRSNELVW